MWDVLVTLGNLAFIPALMPVILNKEAYVPRLTSGMSLLGVAVVIVGLTGAGLVLSPIVVAVIGMMWVLVFLFRGRPA
ncbi:MAG TPA: hypothetical protein VFT91_01285 [Dehalococcoidia bacterium]|nr:hypothetical protein [Dehalococcoidia bacterium]